MEYRKATKDDIDVLVEMRQRQLADEELAVSGSIDSDMREYFASALGDGSFAGWVAVEEGAIVGTGGACFFRLPPTCRNPSGRVAYVTNMFTVREYRRRGIATELLERVIGEARERGCGVARLHASSDGRGIYQRFGFAPSEGYMAMIL